MLHFRTLFVKSQLQSVRGLRLLLPHQIRNSWGGLCESTPEVVFHDKPTSVLGLDDQQAGEPCFTKMRCWNGRRSYNTVSERTGHDWKYLLQKFVTSTVDQSNSCYTAVTKLNELFLYCLRNTFNFDCERASCKCHVDLENTIKFHLQASAFS